MSRRAWAIRIAAVAAVPASLALALLAIDILRVPRALVTDDVRFQAAPRVPRPLWNDLGILPGAPGARLLDVGDDVESRKTLALFARIDPARVRITTPEQEALRGRVQLEVTLRSREAGNPRRRAEHLNLLGVLNASRYSSFAPEAQLILSRSIGAFRSAIEVDPTNPDAKRNLEILLRRPEAAVLPPDDVSQGGAQGRVSGQGRAGSGY